MSAFADRFSHTQRAALAALGYTLLERRAVPVGAAVGRDRHPDTHPDTHDDARGATQHEAPAASPHDLHHETSREPLRSPGPTVRPSRPTAAPTVLPGRIVIDGMDRSTLAASIQHAAAAATGEGDPRVQRQGERLAITLDGDGETWQISLQQLRRSPRHKAALWRALRTLRQARR